MEALRARLRATAKERDSYKKAYEAVLLENERLKRGLFGRKAEKVDPAQVALAFAPFKKLLEDAIAEATGAAPAPPADPPKTKKKARSHGRRRLVDALLPEETIDLSLCAPLMDGLVRLGEDISFRVEYRRAHWVRLRIVRPRLVMPNDKLTADRTGSNTTVYIAPMPDEMIPGGIAGPGFLAHVIVQKFADHIPFHRQEQILAREGIVRLDRGTMCRWTQKCHELAHLVVDAMIDEARDKAHVLATDATGVLVQAKEQCKRGHFWVTIADRDHVFFRYTPRHTKEGPKELFKGFKGYLQADASSVYDAMFRAQDGPEEVGCWAHGRRNFYWAVRSHREPSLVAIGFIGKLFEIEREIADLAPSRRLELRRVRSKPVLDAFQEWRDKQLANRELEPRSPLARALRYMLRHWEALTRFLEDGRIRLDNNPSELELRRLVLGRKNWLFVGSDETAPATCTFVSLIASCSLHRLDPEQYMRDLFRVLPSWPRSRVLELAPKYWMRTRLRLEPAELDMPLGPLQIPAPLPPEQNLEHSDAS